MNSNNTLLKKELLKLIQSSLPCYKEKIKKHLQITPTYTKLVEKYDKKQVEEALNSIINDKYLATKHGTSVFPDEDSDEYYALTSEGKELLDE